MRRRTLLVLLGLAACGTPDPPAIGVTVSVHPSAAAAIAAGTLQSGGPALFDADIVLRQGSLTADTALATAERFAADARVLAVIGHANSTASLAASQIYNRAGVVQIAPTTTSTLYDLAGPFSFRMVPGDDRQAAFLAAYGSLGWPASSRTALIYVNDDYGRSFYREMRALLPPLVFDGIYAELGEDDDLRGLALRIAATNPDLLLWLGRPKALAKLLGTLRPLAPGLRVICGDACDDHVVYANQGGAFTGVRFVRFTDPASNTAAVTEFRDRYRDRTGQEASSEAVLTYDAMAVAAAALRDGARTREDVRRYLTSLGNERPALEGLAGPIAFDDAGSVLRGYLLADVTADGVRGVPLPEAR